MVRSRNIKEVLTLPPVRGESSSVAGPIDEFCERLRSDLHSHRSKSVNELEGLRALIGELESAREADVVERYARDRGLSSPARRAPASATIAARLLARVRDLAELQLESETDRIATNSVSAPLELAQPSVGARPAGPVPDHSRSVPNTLWPELEACSIDAPLVVVGGTAAAGKLATLPESLRSKIEWIETSRQGTRAIGNLAQRIRKRRVSALIILDGAVGHKHSEPLVSAARDVKLPTAYAHKGGVAALTRALSELEKMVRRS